VKSAETFLFLFFVFFFISSNAVFITFCLSLSASYRKLHSLEREQVFLVFDFYFRLYFQPYFQPFFEVSRASGGSAVSASSFAIGSFSWQP